MICVLLNFVDFFIFVVWMKNGCCMLLDIFGRIIYRNGNRKMIFFEIIFDDRGWYICVVLDNFVFYILLLVVDFDGYIGYLKL